MNEFTRQTRGKQAGEAMERLRESKSMAGSWNGKQPKVAIVPISRRKWIEKVEDEAEARILKNILKTNCLATIWESQLFMPPGNKTLELY